MRELIWITAAGVFSFLYVAIGNALTLGAWRRSEGRHWAVRARLLWPVRLASTSLGWYLPIAAALTWALIDRSTPLIFPVLSALVSAIGCEIGSLPLQRQAFPRFSVNVLLRSTALGLFFRFFNISVLLIAAALMPVHPTPTMAVIAGAVFAFELIWSLAGWVWLLRRLKLLTPTSARLKTVVETASRQTGIRYSHVWIMRSHFAQALALPATRELIFTERLLEIMSDSELSAICAHEFAHINESKSALIVRIASMFAWYPCIFILPLVHAWGSIGAYLLLAVGAFAPKLFGAFSRKMEQAADSHATSQQTDEGIYARALLRLNEDSLTPVVLQGQGTSHPHTYDRVIAAGITPDFERPEAPASMAWHGMLASIAVGAAIALFVIHILQ
jgi:Zn-dependent protease with chaperone function